MAEVIEHDISLSGDGSQTNPLKVQTSTAQSNILTVDATGVYLNGTHHIFPKFTAGTLYALLTPVKTFPDGSILLRDTFDIQNPQHATSISGIGQYSTCYAGLNQYFLDAAGNPIRTETTVDLLASSSTSITVTVTVMMSAMPVSAWDIFDDTRWPPYGNLNNFSIFVEGAVGYTPSQLNLE